MRWHWLLRGSHPDRSNVLQYPVHVAGQEHHGPATMDDAQCERARGGAGVGMASLLGARDQAGDPSRAGLE